MVCLVLALFGILPFRSDVVTVTCVDWIERNYFYDENAQLIFIQLIFYDHNPVTGCSDVVAWKIDKELSIIPDFNRNTNQVTLFFRDGDKLRMIVAKSFVESWTQYDEEMSRRSELLPAERRGLDTSRLAYYKNRYKALITQAFLRPSEWWADVFKK